MKYYPYIKILFILAAAFVSPAITYAQISKTVGVGEAIIENDNMRTAYKDALQSALIDAIKEYYDNTYENDSDIPDITTEYLKFIKSYKITQRNVTDYKITIGVEVSLDTTTITDATQFINKRLDTAVFLLNKIPANLSDGDVSAIVNKTLQSKNFSTMDQNNFSYLVTDIDDIAQITNAFSSINGKYLFQFNFDTEYGNDEDNVSSCEITATTDIKIKHGEAKTLKVAISSQNPDKRKCVSEALGQAVSSTIDYIRENIIQDRPENSQIYSYEIKLVNFTNMVATNKFISTLSQKGFINTYKAASFASKEIIFNVESIFDPQGLSKKIKEAGLENGVDINENSKGLILDFDRK